jgi:hypothetical protein
MRALCPASCFSPKTSASGSFASPKGGSYARISSPAPVRTSLGSGESTAGKRGYKLDEAGTPPGPLVVVSMADLFADEGGAERDIDAYREEFELARGGAVGVARTIDVPAVGDETFGTSLEQVGVFYYTIAWRFENVTASVLVQGFELSPEDAVALARKQQQRIAKAMSD